MVEPEAQPDIAVRSMEALLGEFRAKRIGRQSVEKHRLSSCLAPLSQAWNARFPGLPEAPFAYSSLKGISRRGQRDAYLKGLVIRRLSECADEHLTLVNPVCVVGRHARELALHLKEFQVIATDISAQFEQWYLATAERIDREKDIEKSFSCGWCDCCRSDRGVSVYENRPGNNILIAGQRAEQRLMCVLAL